MNILILDKDELTWQAIGYFKEFERDWNFFDYSSIVKNRFILADFDLVIVDIADCENQRIYEKILNDYREKKIIVLSESLQRCNRYDCNTCEQQNNIKRLMKPVELNTLYTLISSFDVKCDFFDAFENISSLVESIIKRYRSLLYDTQTKEVRVNLNVPTNLYTQEFVSFINVLEQNSVAYSIIDETKLIIR